MSDIGSQVRDILAFHLGIDGSQLGDDTRFEDLGADSLDVVEIVMSCEERFGVEIPNREATGLATVGDAVRCVDSPDRGGSRPPSWQPRSSRQPGRRAAPIACARP